MLPWWHDQGRTHAELSRYSHRDADVFFRLDGELKSLARYLQPFFTEPPPQVEASGLAGWLEALRVGWRFRGLDGRQMQELLTFLTGSLEQLLDRYFESEYVKRLILANNLYGKHGGPRDAGSAMGLLFHLLSGGEDERPGEPDAGLRTELYGATGKPERRSIRGRRKEDFGKGDSDFGLEEIE